MDKKDPKSSSGFSEDRKSFSFDTSSTKEYYEKDIAELSYSFSTYTRNNIKKISNLLVDLWKIENLLCSLNFHTSFLRTRQSRSAFVGSPTLFACICAIPPLFNISTWMPCKRHPRPLWISFPPCVIGTDYPLPARSAVIGSDYPLPASLTRQRLAKTSCLFCHHWY